MSLWSDATPVRPMPLEELTRWSPRLRKISHDMNNALVPAVAHADLLRLKLGRDAAPASVAALPGHLDAARQTAQRVTAWAMRTPPARPVTWADVRFGLQQLTRSRGMGLAWELEPSHLQAIAADLASVRLLLQSLVANACDACQGHERGRDAGVLVRSKPGWRIDVVDRGPGADRLDSVAAGCEMRHGAGHLGLGLPVAAALAAAMDGQVRVCNLPEGGFVAMLGGIDRAPHEA